MTRDEIEQKIDQWLDGDLAEPDHEGLMESLDQVPDSIAYFADRALLQTLLKQAAASHLPVDAPPRRRSRQAKSLALAACAVLIVSLMVPLLWLPTARGSAAQIVQQTLLAHQPTADRRYRVRVESGRPLPWALARRRGIHVPSTLWVRQNGFVQSFESSDHKLVWGKGSDGSVWFSTHERSVAVFDADEIPAALQDLCDLRSLDLGVLLDSLLKEYDLQRIPKTSELDTIRATPRTTSDGRKFGAVEITIDPKSHLVHQVVLERTRQGWPMALVTFALEEVAPQAEAFYQWQSHVRDGAEVFSRGSRRGARSELLREFLQILRQPS